MILNILTVLSVSLLIVLGAGTGLTIVIEFVALALVVIGVLFFAGTSVGLLRFPDFYTRMHAAGKGDTMSSALILIGCAIYSLLQGHITLASVLVGIKILLIVNFIFIGSPTATHAMMDAGYETEVKHWTKSGGQSQ